MKKTEAHLTNEKGINQIIRSIEEKYGEIEITSVTPEVKNTDYYSNSYFLFVLTYNDEPK